MSRTEYQRQYYLKKKYYYYEKLMCECGMLYDRCGLNKHKISKKHREYMQLYDFRKRYSDVITNIIERMSIDDRKYLFKIIMLESIKSI